jgi:hypothetical protein
MQYLLLIYTSEAEDAKIPEEESKAIWNEYFTFTNDVRARGVYVGGEALHPTSAATTVRVRDGKTISTDGPFAETREQLGGYYVVDVKDIDEATEIAAKIPGARLGSIEIRPIVVFNT